jgi:hypothetical protein
VKRSVEKINTFIHLRAPRGGRALNALAWDTIFFGVNGKRMAIEWRLMYS